MINNTTQINNLYGVANGTNTTGAFVDIFETRDPTINDIAYPIQKKWLNTATGAYWMLQNFVSSNALITANWIKIGSIEAAESLTGNSGGAVTPDSSNNINVLGDTTTINIVGNPSTHTLTASTTGAVATSYAANTGTAVPSAGILNLTGTAGLGIVTSGSSNTVAFSIVDFVSPAANNWTPVVQGSVTAGTATYTYQHGVYARVGQVVFFTYDLTWNSHTGTGNMQISGFPYIFALSNINYPTGTLIQNVTLPSGAVDIYFNGVNAQSYGNIIATISNASASSVGMSAAGSLSAYGFYFADLI
jgi:hypothetical protein